MIQETISGFGNFEFYDKYFIGRIYEGVNAGNEFVDHLTDLIQKHYSGRPIIYISDRINSYSLDVVATTDLIRRNKIHFSAIVAYTPIQEELYSYEKKCIEGTDIYLFSNLDAALSWAKQKALEMD
ncbi:MAG: hypothetical protein GY763_15315 [Gammaproteobacteria bacterium]|nr:hypothetical protein [Gammaproteobacteria bacterium]